MNPRYTDPVVEAIWSRSNQLNLWVVIECSWLRTHSTSAYQDAASAPVPTPEQVMALEEATRHEFVAFLTAWIPGFCTSEAKQWVHYGLTSSDVIDTATAMQLCETATYLEARAADLRAAIQSAESEIVDLIQVGRTHGQWAQPRPVTVGFRTLRQMLERQTERHRLAARDLAYADFSGATGGRELIRAASVHRVLDGLGLRRAGSSTQILPRDGWAHWAHTVAGLVTVCEAIADQYWLLAQSDVGEVSVANGAGSLARRERGWRVGTRCTGN